MPFLFQVNVALDLWHLGYLSDHIVWCQIKDPAMDTRSRKMASQSDVESHIQVAQATVSHRACLVIKP